MSCIISINRNGLRWCDAPAAYGPPKALHNRWKRWSNLGVFAQIMNGLATEHPDNKTISIDATYLKAHRTASSLGLKKGCRRLIGQTNSCMNTKLRAVTDTSGRPIIRFFITAGQVSDYIGAMDLFGSIPDAEWLLADRRYHADWFREALADRGTRPCIPGRKSLNKVARYDKRRYRRWSRIEHIWQAQRLETRRDPL